MARLSLTHWGYSTAPTPSGSAVGEIRFDGLHAGSSYTNFAMIQACIGTNATGGAPSDMRFFTASSGSNCSERMRLDSSGYLGINTTSPSQRLEVRDTSAQLRLSYDGSNYTDIATDSGGNITITPTGGYLAVTGRALSISSTANYRPQLQLFNNNDLNTGSYFIFYRSRAGSAPVDSGDVLGNIWWSGMYNSAYQQAAYISVGVDGSPSGNYVPGVITLGTATASAGPTERMRITSSGNIGIGCIPSYQLQLSTDSAAKPSTNTWTVPSDERLKKDIILADLDRCYEIVRDLPLKRFTWRDDVYTAEQVPDRSKLGWIAQDVEKVFPKAITITEHKISDDEIIKDCRGLNADQLYAVLWGAVQKLQLKVAALEATS
jgi:hypothetical protein